jgi:hypothetical protein
MEAVPRHVFVSFANVDLDVVRRLTARLKVEGLAIWTGDENLAPGTFDWEQAVRAAIDDSFAVVLVASPASARSVYVRGELGIAGARRLPVFAVWAQGATWADCAPLMLTSSQYIDCRGQEFERGVTRLAEAIRPLADRAMPSHFARPRLEPFPPSCVSVGLPRGATASGSAGDAAAIVKIGAYSSLEVLLDELYSSYLRELYEPLTYGSRWILVEARSEAFGFAVAPWPWLSGARIDRQWVRGHAPTDCQMLPGTSWKVAAIPAAVYGLALSDARVLRALRATAKSDLALRRDGYLGFRPVSTIDVTAFSSALVCSGRSHFWRDEEAGPNMALVQLKPVPDEELQWHLADREA